MDTSADPQRFQLKVQFIAPKPLKASVSGWPGWLRRLQGNSAAFGFRGRSAEGRLSNYASGHLVRVLEGEMMGAILEWVIFARLPGLLPNASRGARILEAGSLTTLVGIAAAVARSLEKVLGGAFRHIALSQPSKCHL